MDWIAFINQVGFPIGLITAIALFISRQVWPFVRDEYWPAIVRMRELKMTQDAELQKEQNSLLRVATTSLNKLEVICGQQLLLIQQHEIVTAQNQTDLIATLGLLRPQLTTEQV